MSEGRKVFRFFKFIDELDKLRSAVLIEVPRQPAMDILWADLSLCTRTLSPGLLSQACTLAASFIICWTITHGFCPSSWLVLVWVSSLIGLYSPFSESDTDLCAQLFAGKHVVYIGEDNHKGKFLPLL